MPQTYIRAVGPGAVGRSWRVAVSCSRNGRPVPGRRGTGVAGQERMAPRYCVSLGAWTYGRRTAWAAGRTTLRVLIPLGAPAGGVPVVLVCPAREVRRVTWLPPRAVESAALESVAVMRVSELAVPHSLARMLPVLPAAPARLVEVGAGDGALAAALRERGYDVTVVEPDPGSAQACRDRGLAVVQAPVEDFDGGDYHAVLFTRVLHHVADPAAVMRRAAAACRPGGVVVLEDF